MSNMHELFKLDAASERDGVWIDYGPFRVRVCRAGGSNKSYQKALEEKTRPHRRAVELGLMDNDLATDILREVYANTVVKGWETRVDGKFVSGIESQDGTLLPFTRENVLATFRDLPDLFTDLTGQASQLTLFRAQLREEAAGN